MIDSPASKQDRSARETYPSSCFPSTRERPTSRMMCNDLHLSNKAYKEANVSFPTFASSHQESYDNTLYFVVDLKLVPTGVRISCLVNYLV